MNEITELTILINKISKEKGISQKDILAKVDTYLGRNVNLKSLPLVDTHQAPQVHIHLSQNNRLTKRTIITEEYERA